MNKHFIFHIDKNIFSDIYFSDEAIASTKVNLATIFQIARQLKADVYYPLKAIVALQEEMELFEDNYTQSKNNLLDVLLQDFISSDEINYFFKIHFANQNTSLEYENIDLSKNICDKNAIHILLSLSTNEDCINLLHVESNTQFSPIKVYPFSNAEKLWIFINQQLPKRKYNFSAKHGNENTVANPPKRGEKVSQLRCTDETAQKLLDTAIFDWRERAWCYNFDIELDTYIIFPYEGDTPQNQFHAFHIEKSEWVIKIPRSIREYFNKGI